MRLNKRKIALKNLMNKVQQEQFERIRDSAFARVERILEAEDIERWVEVVSVFSTQCTADI